MDSLIGWGTLVAFASGIGVSLVGAIAASVLQRRAEARKRLEEIQFRVYMGLLNVYNLYFWVASTELRGDGVTPDLKQRIRDEAFKVADLLRSEDRIHLLERILQVLMSNEFPSATERHREMDKLIDELGESVNPRYQKAIRAISRANVVRIGSGERSAVNSTTPGSMGPL